MVANLVLIASAIAALVYLLQTYLRRYSLLTLLAVLSVFPLYWALGRLIFVFGGFRSGEWYIIAVYLSPIPAAIAAKCSFYARIKEWARVRLNWMFRDCPFDDYDNADDAISAASRLDTRGDWDESIDLYRRASQRWPEHSEYIQSSIDRVIEKQSLART
jgi:hypothetical protein